MGQQESSYRKFDDRVRRRRRENSGKKEARKEQEKEEEVTPTSSSIMVEKEKVKGGGHFSLANLRWRPGLVVGTSPSPSSDGPGWYHGWCNKAQVRPVNSGTQPSWPFWNTTRVKPLPFYPTSHFFYHHYSPKKSLKT